MSTIDPNSYLRLCQIIGREAITAEDAATNADAGKRGRRPRTAVPALIPVSKSTWWAGVKSGRYPKPVKLGPRATAWRASEVLAVAATPV